MNFAESLARAFPNSACVRKSLLAVVSVVWCQITSLGGFDGPIFCEESEDSMEGEGAPEAP
jgi:hypothetical protein